MYYVGCILLECILYWSTVSGTRTCIKLFIAVFFVVVFCSLYNIYIHVLLDYIIIYFIIIVQQIVVNFIN